MLILFLGNGSALNFDRGNTNIILSEGSSNILLDCGITCPAILKKRGWLDIRDIAISHLHGDHVGGLEAIAWYNYVRGERINVYSKVDVRSYLLPAMGEYADKVIDFHDGDFSVGNIGVKFIETEHVDNMRSFGYVVGGKILFTMDTKNAMVGNYDVIFHDCASIKNGSHVSIGELRGLPKEVKKKIWLMHLDGGDYGDVSDFAGRVLECQTNREDL